MCRKLDYWEVKDQVTDLKSGPLKTVFLFKLLMSTWNFVFSLFFMEASTASKISRGHLLKMASAFLNV